MSCVRCLAFVLLVMVAGTYSGLLASGSRSTDAPVHHTLEANPQARQTPRKPTTGPGRSPLVRLPEFTLTTLDGTTFSSGVLTERVVVVAFLAASCRTVLALEDDLRSLIREIERAKLDAGFVAVGADLPSGDIEPTKRFLARLGYQLPYVVDKERHLARALGVTVIPEYFVFNHEKVLTYRGPLNDAVFPARSVIKTVGGKLVMVPQGLTRFTAVGAVGYPGEIPTEYLLNAIRASLVGKRPASATSMAEGCVAQAAQSDQAPIQEAASTQQTCEAGDLAACNQLGLLYLQGVRVQRDPDRAAALFRKACDGGDPAGCYHLGNAILKGEGAAKDIVQAADLFRKACEAGEMRSCTNLGGIYSEGLGVASDSRRAVQLFKRACDGRDPAGCYNLANAYRKGLGVGTDLSVALRLYKQACDGKNGEACSDLGYFYAEGNAVAKDLSETVRLFREGCDLGSLNGCYNLAESYRQGTGVAMDMSQAAPFYERACAPSTEPSQPWGEGQLKACRQIGLMYAIGQGVTADLERGVALLKRACNGGESVACEALRRLGR